MHSGPGIGLGVQRLAIVDLATGDQPIGNEDGSILAICNGEIYNHVALREWLEARGHRFRTGSDVEVIVHLYEEEGVESVSRLRGMFAFALWDTRRRRLWLARDRLGIKPLHYADTPTGLYFASEQKAILAAGVPPGPLDVRALDDLFLFGFVPDAGHPVPRDPPAAAGPLAPLRGRARGRPAVLAAGRGARARDLAARVVPRTGPRRFTRSWRRRWRCTRGPTCASARG